LFAGFVTTASLRAAPENNAEVVSTALRQPWGKLFWIERKAGKYHLGDPVSDFNSGTDYSQLTFDIGNNAMLANVGVQGELKAVTSCRDTYKTVTSSWPGVWTCKDTSTCGPYAFTLEMDGQTNNLATVGWDFRSGLLDNLFPVTEFTGPGSRFTVRLLTFAPVSADGSQRLRGVVYGLQLENNSQSSLRATIVLPKASSGTTPYHRWAQSSEYDAFDLGLGDAAAFTQRVPVTLQPGESCWVPAIICTLDEGVVQAVNARGTAAWLVESQHYYRGLLGRLNTPDEPFVSEFYERSVMQALQALVESASGRIAGANWGSVPPTRMIWTKDMFHAGLPFMTLDPTLAGKIIQWFDTYGVRPEGTVLRGDQFPKDGELVGGVNHSVSLSIAAPLMAGILYNQTGDAALFRQHPEWKTNWAGVLDAVLASRQDKDVWLFPTRYISDGPVSGDFHAGSNVCVWRALTAFARLLAEVWNDPAAARRYADAADKVKAALLDKCVITGPFGKQFIEATWCDGRPPKWESDGEESDTTLMPFYGFLAYDDATYLNYMKFSMSTNNVKFTPALNCLAWEESVPSTAPGYSKGLCAGVDRESLFGENGFFTTLRKVTDADGSVWWWSYGSGKNVKPKLVRAYMDIGKASWAAGVNGILIPSRFLGVSYDAPRREIRFAPLAAMGNFSWQDFPIGNDRFGISYETGSSGIHATFENLNDHLVTIEATLPVGNLNPPFSVTANGQPVKQVQSVKYLGQAAVRLSCPVAGKKTVEFRATGVVH
jgi:hypothetical protein